MKSETRAIGFVFSTFHYYSVPEFQRRKRLFHLSLPSQQQTAKYREVDKKRWFVRYLILAAVATVLALKIYWLLFVVDFFVGLYSVSTSIFLFTVLFLAYVKFRDPYLKARHIVLSQNNSPLITIVGTSQKRGG